MNHTVKTSGVAADLTKELRRISELWVTSIDEREASFVDQFMDRTFQYVDFLGNVRNVLEYKDRFYGQRTWNLVRHKTRDCHVQPLDDSGSCAIVIGQYYVELQLSDGLIVGELMGYSTVWRRTPCGWKALRHQTLALS
jgi:hypothetical protein